VASRGRGAWSRWTVAVDGRGKRCSAADPDPDPRPRPTTPTHVQGDPRKLRRPRRATQVLSPRPRPRFYATRGDPGSGRPRAGSGRPRDPDPGSNPTQVLGGPTPAASKGDPGSEPPTPTQVLTRPRFWATRRRMPARGRRSGMRTLTARALVTRPGLGSTSDAGDAGAPTLAAPPPPPPATAAPTCLSPTVGYGLVYAPQLISGVPSGDVTCVMSCSFLSL
jgi:hypothetical protein